MSGRGRAHPALASPPLSTSSLKPDPQGDVSWVLIALSSHLGRQDVQLTSERHALRNLVPHVPQQSGPRRLAPSAVASVP